MRVCDADTPSHVDTPTARGRVPSRRELLGALGVLAGLGARAALAGPPSAGAVPLPLWLVNRCTFGLTTSEATLRRQLGHDGYLEYHLAHEQIDDSALNARLANYTTLTMTPVQLLALPAGQVMNELIEATILRAVLSKRQLFERMVEFWTDHFNIDHTKGLCQFLKTVDDRDVVRTHALGNFADLLLASAQSPAMLYYLDNTSSVVGNPNENYSRELLELHTLGVGGGYTQTDVEEVARCFTGWSLYPPGSGANTGKFRFNAGIHDNGPKVVLGQNIPANGGINDGLIVLDILANHPSTAQFIARKLCARFVSHDPPQSLIDSVAQTYTASGGDFREMLRTIFALQNAEHFAPKYKRPFHHFVSILRATGATITTLSQMRSSLLAAGHLPFRWSSPDGYPDDIDFWVGLILPRWNFGASLLEGQIGGLSVSATTFFAGANTAAQCAARIAEALYDRGMPQAERARLTEFLLPDAPTTQRKRDGLGLACSAPGYQWY